LFGSVPSKLKPSPIIICAVKPAGSGVKVTLDVSPAEREKPLRMEIVCVVGWAAAFE
jgi:hypothetical protein